MNQEFIGALKEIVKDKGISEDLLFTTIEDALVAAYKKNYASPTTSAQNVKVSINRETGEIHVYAQKVVVEDVYDNVTEISIEEAKEISPRYDLDDIVDYGIVIPGVSAQQDVIAVVKAKDGKTDAVKASLEEYVKDLVAGHLYPEYMEAAQNAEIEVNGDLVSLFIVNSEIKNDVETKYAELIK